jgi:hypothetical protein
MKTRNKYLFFFISIISLIYLSGCTHVWNITETPFLQMGSPLRGIEPKTFAFRDFKDIRGVENPSLMAEVGGHTHLYDQPPAIFIADRIKKEFERNGHKCIDASLQANSDFIVDGKIYVFSIQHKMGLWTQTQFANAGVKLTINRVPSESGVLEKTYKGEYTSTGTKWVVAVGQAVLSMIKEISTDSELIEFIKK